MSVHPPPVFIVHYAEEVQNGRLGLWLTRARRRARKLILILQPRLAVPFTSTLCTSTQARFCHVEQSRRCAPPTLASWNGALCLRLRRSEDQHSPHEKE